MEARANPDRRSLHQRILSDVEGRILSGEWSPGYRIPFEHELTAQYGCSRMTVSKVLNQLARAGLIERRRRSGSFVLRPHSQSAVLEIRDIMVEVQALGLAYRFDIVKRTRRQANRSDLDRLHLDKSVPVLELACRHFGGDQPFCFEERLINLDAVPEADAETFAERAPSPWLVEQVPWSTGEHRIQAIGATAATAAALDIARGTPCLLIERRTWSAEQPITHVRLTYPGEGHELVARFAPSQG
ncbi:histidine utilization repressor [Pseudaminobacter arsenicus]|uniref:Histidine utilization repressor n=1 Tax=Borborobacter arsenicus TaxID=1851146 RepID=A0A432V1S9_9HYPH|nr:histidine utilization repressor [Pseudaminobacter arsenicus]RUM96075.1 histidine utilization repressor [Pseudaminobacter arsenicus]